MNCLLFIAFLEENNCKKRVSVRNFCTYTYNRGGGRKPWPQKGTGRAPLGSIRAPQCRGGGHVKEKRPKDWSIKMNIKERRYALRSALSAKAFEGKLFVMEGLGAPSEKTRDMVRRVEGVWPRGVKRDGTAREEYR